MVWKNYPPEADEIIANLFLGNGTSSVSLEKWKYKPIKTSYEQVIDLNLSAVVNCTPKLENPQAHLEYFRVPVNDKDKSEKDLQKIKMYLDQAVEFIHSFWLRTNKC
jgi:hypothetical protein